MWSAGLRLVGVSSVSAELRETVAHLLWCANQGYLLASDRAALGHCNRPWWSRRSRLRRQQRQPCVLCGDQDARAFEVPGYGTAYVCEPCMQGLG